MTSDGNGHHHADSFIWTNASGTRSWTDPKNWSDDGAPATKAPGPHDKATFPGHIDTVATDSAGHSVAAVNFGPGSDMTFVAIPPVSPLFVAGTLDLENDCSVSLDGTSIAAATASIHHGAVFNASRGGLIPGGEANQIGAANFNILTIERGGQLNIGDHQTVFVRRDLDDHSPGGVTFGAGAKLVVGTFGHGAVIYDAAHPVPIG